MVKDIKTSQKEKKETELYASVRHIITNLYRIKNIDRKINYKPEILAKLVMQSPIGKQVIGELKELKVTRYWLLENNFDWFEEVLGNNFKEE